MEPQISMTTGRPQKLETDRFHLRQCVDVTVDNRVVFDVPDPHPTNDVTVFIKVDVSRCPDIIDILTVPHQLQSLRNIRGPTISPGGLATDRNSFLTATGSSLPAFSIAKASTAAASNASVINDAEGSPSVRSS